MDDIIESPPRSPTSTTASSRGSSDPSLLVVAAAAPSKLRNTRNTYCDVISSSGDRGVDGDEDDEDDGEMESVSSVNESIMGDIFARGDALQLSMSALRKILQFLRKQLLDKDERIKELEVSLRKKTSVLAERNKVSKAEEAERSKVLLSAEAAKSTISNLERELLLWKRRVDVAESSQAETTLLLEQTRRDFSTLTNELASLKQQENDKAQSIVLSMQAPLKEEMSSLRRKVESLRRECEDMEHLRLEALQRVSEDAGVASRRAMEKDCGALVPAGEVMMEKRRVTQLQEDLHIAHLSNMRLLQILAGAASGEGGGASSASLVGFTNSVLRDSKTTLLTLMGNERCAGCGDDMRLGSCTCGKRIATSSSVATSVFILPPASSVHDGSLDGSKWGGGTGIPVSSLYSGTYHDPRSKATRTSNQLLRNGPFDGNRFIEAVSNSISLRRAELQEKRGGRRVNESDVALVSDAALQEMKYLVTPRGGGRGGGSSTRKQRAGASSLPDSSWLRSLVDNKCESDYWIPHGAFVAAQSWRDDVLSMWQAKHGDTMFATVADHLSAERFFPLFLSMNKVWRARTQPTRFSPSSPQAVADENESDDAKVLWRLVQEKLRSTVSMNSSTMRVATLYDEVVSTCLKSLDAERRKRRKLETKIDGMRRDGYEEEVDFLRSQLDTLSDSVCEESEDLANAIDCTCQDVHHFLDVAEKSLLCERRGNNVNDNNGDSVVAGFGRVLEFVREFVVEVAASTNAASLRIQKHSTHHHSQKSK